MRAMSAAASIQRRVRLRVAMGDITRWKAEAIATSANAGLIGNSSPSYWRFRVPTDGPWLTVGCVNPETSTAFNNVDGQVHAAAGPELDQALTELAQPLRFKMLGGSGPWRGGVLPSSSDGLVACPAGGAVVTPSFGALREYCKWVVHAVAPDGRYVQSKAAAMPILRDTFVSALSKADEAGATSLAVPSIGCGVHNWSASHAARCAFDALEAWRSGGGAVEGGSLERLDVVLREEADWDAWRGRACERFGEPTDAEEEGAAVWTVGE